MPTRRRFLKTLAALVAVSKTLPFSESVSQSQLANDPFRPQFHLLPPRNWMNDPDGPLYFNGHYHMFYQYNPNAAVWGDMHWAHAVSPDMLHWQHLPIALAPTTGGPDADGCFSGSAILYQGVPTFLYTGVKAVPPSEATLRDGKHNFLETQCLARSYDADLRTWQKHATPVLLPPQDGKPTGFRDPCLWQEQNLWYMGIGSGQRGAGGQILLYRSRDLLVWEYLHPLAHGESANSDHADPVDAGDMWECPDFFPLDGKHVLLYSTQRKVFWEVGEYDPKEHLFHAQKRGLLDHGAFYAPKSQLDSQGRRILWGWIPETRRETEYTLAGWAGCMSLPRIVGVNRSNELTMNVIPEADSLSARNAVWEVKQAARSLLLEKFLSFRASNPALRIEIKTSDKPFRLSLEDGTSSFVQIAFDPSSTGHELQLNSCSTPLPSGGSDTHRITIFLDASVLECFADDTLALTSRFYRAPQSPLRFSASDSDLSALHSVSTSLVKPISPDRLTR